MQGAAAVLLVLELLEAVARVVVAQELMLVQ
jgi:hypothetical protein